MDIKIMEERMRQIAERAGLEYDGCCGVDKNNILQYDNEKINVFVNLMTENLYDQMEKEIHDVNVKGQGYEIYCWNDASCYDYWYEEGVSGCSNYIQISVAITDLECIDVEQLKSDVEDVHCDLSHWDNVNSFMRSKMEEEELGGGVVVDVEELDEFTEAYIVCALWSSNDESNESGGNPLDDNYDKTDLEQDALEEIVRECKEFQAKYGDMFAGQESQAGHDFWLTRNGHGAGFWDRDDEIYSEDYREKLTKKSESYGEAHIMINDDNKLYYYNS